MRPLGSRRTSRMKWSTASSGRRPNRSPSCSAKPPGASKSAVRVGPGETTLERTPRTPNSAARDLETESSAVLVAA